MKLNTSIKLVGIAVGVVGLALVVALSQAAPPPRPRPHRRPVPPRRLRPLPPKRARVARHARPVVLRRHRRLMVRRMGTSVVVVQQDGEGNETVTTPQPQNVTTAEAMKQVPAASFGDSSAHKVARTATGFSVVANIGGVETPIRLVGVTPAGRATGTSNDAEQGQWFFRNLLSGEFVHVKADSTLAETDEDGKKVGYLYRVPDGLFVNLELVRQGYALAARGYSFEHQELFRFYEGKAVADGKGIWAAKPAAEQMANEERTNN